MYGRVLDFCAHGSPVNQLSLVCLYKHTLETSPGSGMLATTFVLAVLAYIAKHSLHLEFPDECRLVREHMDDALCKSWKTFQGHGCPRRFGGRASG